MPEAPVTLTIPLQPQRQRTRVCTRLPLCLRSFFYFFFKAPNTMGAGCFWRQSLACSPSRRIHLVYNPARSTGSTAQPVLCCPASSRSEGLWQLISGSSRSSGRCGENKLHGMHLSRFFIHSFRPHTGCPCRTAVNTACDRALAKRPVVLQWIQMGLRGEQLCVNRKGELPPASSKTYHSTAK